MAGKSRVRVLEERAQRILSQRRDDPMQKAIEALTDEEIDRLMKIKDTQGPDAAILEFFEARR